MKSSVALIIVSGRWLYNSRGYFTETYYNVLQASFIVFNELYHQGAAES